MILEGDSMIIMNTIAGEEPDLLRIGHLVDDKRNLLENFRTRHIQHVRTEGNRVP